MNFLNFNMKDGEILELEKSIENLREKDIEDFLSIENCFSNGVFNYYIYKTNIL